MSMTFLRAARLPASAALICLLLGNASAFAAAAAGGGHAPAGAAASGGNAGPVTTDALVLPNNPDRPPYWHRHNGQKAHGACPLEFPPCWQDDVD